MSRPTRRTVLGGLGALAVPAVPVAAGAASYNPDAVLLEACTQYMAREAEYDAAYQRQCVAQDAGDKAEADWLFDLQRELVRAQDQPIRVVIDTPALTPAGRLAKAEVAMTRVQVDLAGRALSPDDAMIWSLAEDLAGKPLVPRP